MNNILHISKKVDYTDLENYLNEINNGVIDSLSIVKNLSSFNFAIYPIILQTISTLFEKHPKTKVLIKSLMIEDILGASKELIYLTSVMRANFLVNDTNKEFQKNYIENAKTFLNNMRENSTIQSSFKGIGTQLVCFDWSKNYSNPDTLYNGTKLIEKNEFVNSLSPLLFKFSMSQAPSWEKTKQNIEEDFANIVYELFENTELHAKDTSRIKKSVRGLRIKYTKLHKHANRDQYEEIKDYLKEFKNQEFMEISVFDSGKGLASSLADDIEFNFKKEKELVLKCFNKHVSRTGLNTRGLGLFEVMKMIKKHKGLFVLRTGKTLLKADYSAISFTENKVNLDDKYILECQKIIGTSYTIILPLLSEGNKYV